MHSEAVILMMADESDDCRNAATAPSTILGN
jgi:hypothetical protein